MSNTNEVTEIVRFNHRGRTYRLSQGNGSVLPEVLEQSGEWTKLVEQTVLTYFTRSEVAFLAEAMMTAGMLGGRFNKQAELFAEFLNSPVGADHGFGSSVANASATIGGEATPVITSRPPSGLN